MTRIDFYVLQVQQAEERLQFAVRLAEKAWQQNCKVLIVAADTLMVENLDKLLWYTKPESFIPHSRDPAVPDPVSICLGTTEPPHRELLINLAPGAPSGFEYFQRVAEIVVQLPEILAATRLNYSHYRERGHNVNTHKL
jgi:DNA polymerase-3 subunit chi